LATSFLPHLAIRLPLPRSSFTLEPPVTARYVLPGFRSRPQARRDRLNSTEWLEPINTLTCLPARTRATFECL
jgi:hypothetical protein